MFKAISTKESTLHVGFQNDITLVIPLDRFGTLNNKLHIKASTGNLSISLTRADGTIRMFGHPNEFDLLDGDGFSGENANFQEQEESEVDVEENMPSQENANAIGARGSTTTTASGIARPRSPASYATYVRKLMREAELREREEEERSVERERMVREAKKRMRYRYGALSDDYDPAHGSYDHGDNVAEKT
jgi:hypothetical protein